MVFKNLLKMCPKFGVCTYKIFLPLIESIAFIRVSKVSMSSHKVKNHFKSQNLHEGLGPKGSR